MSGTRLNLSFQDGIVQGHSGCNTFRATFKRDGDRLVIGPAAANEGFTDYYDLPNESAYADPEFDALLEKALATPDVEARRAIMADIETRLRESGVIIPLTR